VVHLEDAERLVNMWWSYQFTRWGRKKCTTDRGTSLFGLPTKVYAKCLETRCRKVIETKQQDTNAIFVLYAALQSKSIGGKSFVAQW